MNIIIPLGGIGERFSNNGYTKPKPLIKVLGKEIIFWVLDSLNISESDTVLDNYYKLLKINKDKHYKLFYSMPLKSLTVNDCKNGLDNYNEW